MDIFTQQWASCPKLAWTPCNLAPVAPLTNFICNQIGKHVTIYLYIANRKCPIWIGAQGQIQVLIENSSLNHFCTIRIHKTNQFSSILFHRIRYKNTFFWVCSLLILGPNHISSITVHNTIFFRFCRHYFFVLSQMFWWWFWKNNWFWKLVAKDFENVIHQLILEFCFWCCCGNPELCNDVMENETALLTEQFYSETAQPLLIKHTTFWRKKMNVT